MKKNVLNILVFCLFFVHRAFADQSTGSIVSTEIHLDKRPFFILLALMFLLLIGVGVVFFKQVGKLKLQLRNEQRARISQEKHRRHISSELHNTIGQNVLFIRNQMIKDNHLELIPAVDDMLEGIRNISRGLYPVQLEKYGLAAAIEALAEDMQQRSSIFISYDLEALNTGLSDEQKINYYRIIEESMLNAIRHSEASALRISALNTGKGIELTIQDNGLGFDKSVESKPTSTGMLNIKVCTQFLGGKFALHTSAGNGTKLIFYIPT